jgi:hypothetical protein
MSVIVTPDHFSFVIFDAAVIADVATALLERLGMTEHEVIIEVDETTPLARISAAPGSPIVVSAESGAFEDTKRPRHMSETAIATSLARVLLKTRDRMDGTFGEAPDDDDLSLAQIAAWETYCVGRFSRLGYPVHQQRWRYNFRNRHGFTNSSDATFDELFESERLTWGELAAISDGAIAAKLSV